jgi:hypothetical protein
MNNISIALAAVLVLTGCAGADPKTSSVQTGVHCVKEGERGRCKEWMVGPTPRERAAFEASWPGR